MSTFLQSGRSDQQNFNKMTGRFRPRADIHDQRPTSKYRVVIANQSLDRQSMASYSQTPEQTHFSDIVQNQKKFGT